MKYLDLETWSRRDLFEFFRQYDQPYFNICTRLDITNLLNFLSDRPEDSKSLAYHYLALRIANETEPFRYRIKGEQVVVHDVIHCATIVLRPNESMNFAYFDYADKFVDFQSGARRSMEQASRADAAFSPSPHEDLIHFTTLPWVSLTSFAHARNSNRATSVPKIAFGKYLRENERMLLPISVEVHHALMDGLHVGRFLTRLEEAMAEPELHLS